MRVRSPPCCQGQNSNYCFEHALNILKYENHYSLIRVSTRQGPFRAGRVSAV
jgi:hypothetical protein